MSKRGGRCSSSSSSRSCSDVLLSLMLDAQAFEESDNRAPAAVHEHRARSVGRGWVPRRALRGPHDLAASAAGGPLHQRRIGPLRGRGSAAGTRALGGVHGAAHRHRGRHCYPRRFRGRAPRCAGAARPDAPAGDREGRRSAQRRGSREAELPRLVPEGSGTGPVRRGAT